MANLIIVEKQRVYAISKNTNKYNEIKKYEAILNHFNSGIHISSVFLSAKAQNVKQYKSNVLTSNLVTCIVQDRAGYIWIGTEHGLNKYDGYRFTNYIHSDKDSTSLLNNVIVRLFIDKSGNLFIGTNMGLCTYNYRNDNFRSFDTKGGEKPRISSIIQLHNGKILAGTQGYGVYYVNNKEKSLDLINLYDNDGYFTSLFEDKYDRIWKSGNEHGLVCYDNLEHNKIKTRHYNSNIGNPVAFLKDNNGSMLIVCQHGLMKYLDDKGQLVSCNIKLASVDGNNFFINSGFKANNGDIFLGSIGNGIFYKSGDNMNFKRLDVGNIDFDLNTADVRFIFKDRENNLWIGCDNKGVLYVPKDRDQFHNWNFASQGYQVGNAITSMCKGNDGSIWCTVTNNGVYKFDASGKIIRHVKTPVRTDIIFQDKNGHYWVGAYDQLYSYDPESGQAKSVAKMSGVMMNCIADDGHGNLYVSTFSKGLTTYNKKTHQLRNFSMYDNNKKKGFLCNDWVTALYFDSCGMLWIGTTAGIACYSPGNDSFLSYGWNYILTKSTGYCFCEDEKRNILIGTNEGLYLFDRHANHIMPFPGSNILKDKIICKCIKDKNGNFWFSTSMGIWQYNGLTKRFLSYVNGNGLSAREYMECIGVHFPDDRICFATSDGVISFYPKDINNGKSHIGELRLTNLLIGGKTVNCSTLSNGEHVTSKAVDVSDQFNISYLDNTFIMEFSLMDFSHNGNVVFEYRLNGSEEWIPTEEGRNSIVFSHLQPDNYTLEVRAYDNGVYSNVKVFHINVIPPWYRNTMAYIIYALLIVGAIVLGIYLYNRRKHEELYEEKMQFLMNATHDIRSPLTLILGPLHKLMKKGFNEEISNELNAIDRNAQRILKLVSQILDVRKFDKNQMHLCCQETMMAGYIENICKNFEYRAKESNIKFSFECNDHEIKAWIDRINFDKVITNLLSNAFKYTKENGEIKVVLTQGYNPKAKFHIRYYVEISVIDNGMGLLGTNPEKLFNRFYQGDNSRCTGIQGTGIGLNLCKMIVDFHHGSIIANNRKEDQGACFTVRIPLGNAHLKDDEMISAEPQEGHSFLQDKKKTGNQLYNILIVDDDSEIISYISCELVAYYRFSACGNGKEALAFLLKNKCDLVISDIVMPEMDGYTLVKMIKQNSNICHIPVILLTSKQEMNNRLEGLEKGADAYIGKPFDMEELHLTINNLIKNMQRLKGKFSGSLNQETKVENKRVEANNDLLMGRIMESVNKNLSDNNYTIEQMAADAGVSRAQLHRKMKEITGVSAGDFLRNIRLEQAIKLLREQNINITQIAYTVGFSSESHFSTVFRKHFGVSPSEYINNMNKLKYDEKQF